MGSKMLSKIQLGREATPGTAVAATTVWRGMGTFDDQRVIAFAPENIGLLAEADRTYTPKYGAQVAMEPVEATFEQLPHICEAGITLVGTGVADGIGSGKIYEYPFPIFSPVAITDTDAIKTYTIEAGDNIAAEEVEYAFVSEFTLEGVAGEAWRIGATWLGRQSSPCSFTTDAAIPAVEEMLFSKTKLYVDAYDTDFGTTLITASLLQASLKVVTGWKQVWTADGYLYPTFIKNDGAKFELQLTLENNAVSVAERANWKAHTPRLVRLLCEGSALSSTGSEYSTKTAIIDLAGKWSVFDPYGESDGNTIQVCTLKGAYNLTTGKLGGITVVNEVASIP